MHLLLNPQFVTFFVLLMLGLIVGGTVQRRHFASIARRKAGYADILITQLKSFPQWRHGEKPPRMVAAERGWMREDVQGIRLNARDVPFSFILIVIVSININITI